VPRSPVTCPDLTDAPTGTEPRTPGRCEDHTPEDGIVVHLRMCLVCGHVGCCDQSKNKHATRHFHATGHPVIRSDEPGETWGWCYVDRIFKDPV
jgi:uncharacterized UBP type Zn finger protein